MKKIEVSIEYGDVFSKLIWKLALCKYCALGSVLGALVLLILGIANVIEAPWVPVVVLPVFALACFFVFPVLILRHWYEKILVPKIKEGFVREGVEEDKVEEYIEQIISALSGNLEEGMTLQAKNEYDTEFTDLTDMFKEKE